MSYREGEGSFVPYGTVTSSIRSFQGPRQVGNDIGTWFRYIRPEQNVRSDLLHTECPTRVFTGEDRQNSCIIDTRPHVSWDPKWEPVRINRYHVGCFSHWSEWPGHQLCLTAVSLQGSVWAPSLNVLLRDSLFPVEHVLTRGTSYDKSFTQPKDFSKYL